MERHHMEVVAFGFDRLCAIMGGQESIRDFIAFPKNNSGRDVMIDSPSNIDEKQLNELSIQIKRLDSQLLLFLNVIKYTKN